MCIIEDLSTEYLSKENILRYVDDYSIYTHYIGEELEIGMAYSSPLRNTDAHPSFALFMGRDSKIYFKDHATMHKGDVFQFVRVIMGEGNPERISFKDVLIQIDNDFKIGLYTEESNSNKLILNKLTHKPLVKDKYSIKITSKKKYSEEFLNFWNRYDISLETLSYYNIKDVLIIHYSRQQTKKNFQIYPKELCIAYRIGSKHKLYFPYACKGKKFQNDYPPNWVEGLLQLKYHKDFIIITKSMKEVIFFREHFDWDTVAGKSETTLIPDHILRELFYKYSKVYIWLDNDQAGRNAQEKYLFKYPTLIPIVYNVEQKDPTDRYEYLKSKNKANLALKEIKNCIN